MQRWKAEFTVSSQKKCIQINRNGDFEHGRILYMEPDWDCLDLLNAASQRLDMVPAARRIFNVDGNEIDDCMMVEDHDILFFSIHEDFITISNNNDDNRGDNGKNRPGEGIPPVIGGYKVGELLGRGGFGEVRIGEHQLTAERVALKFLRKSEIHSLRAAERTNVEIQCLATLKHSNIIKMHQHLECQYHFVLVFELMEGGDLLSYLLNRKGYNEGPSGEAAAAEGTSVSVNTGTIPAHPMVQHKRHRLSEDEARHTFYQVLCAISYAHNQHICHRDLKLENILLKDNNLSVVKIADFGLSDFYRPGATMKSSCGTLSFLAPEVFQDTANAGPPLDVWSLGVILFAILNGRLPFEGPDLKGSKRPRENVIRSRIMKCQYKMDENLSVESKDLMRRLLQVDPVERASIPEIFNHMWMRTYGTQSSYLSESYFAATTAFAVQTPHHGNGISLFPSLASSTPTVKHLPPLASMATGSDAKRTDDDTTAEEQEEDLTSPVVKQDPIGKSGSFPANSQSPTDGTSVTADGEAAIDSISHVGASSSHPPYIDGSQKALSSKALSVILENDESVNVSNSFKLAPLRRGYTQHNLTDETSGAGVDSPMKATHNGAAAVVRPSTTIGYVKRNTDADDDAVRTSHWRNIRIDVLGPHDSPKTTKNRKHSVGSATTQGNHQPLFTTTTKINHRRDSVQNTRHGHASNTYSNHNRSSHHAASPRTPAADHDSGSTFLPPTASHSQSPAPSSSSSVKHHHGGAHAMSSTASTQQGATTTPHQFPKPPMSASSGSSSSLQHSHHHYSAIFSGKSHGGAGAGNK